MTKYNPSKIEKKWQRFWDSEKLYNAEDSVPVRKNFMLLAEFPYTSGNLHMGHWFTYSIADVYARYLRMNGYNVMYPIGFDAFGLPAENAAIKHDSTPEKWTKKNIGNMTKQLRSIGAAFDWSRVVDTSNPDYYKWTQWIFLKLYEAGLAYRAQTPVNWCPKDKTVLANEQVINGRCDRCDTLVEQRELTQWMFKITAFADPLIDDLNNLKWPEDTKAAQANWIGRSEGTIAEFKLENIDESIEVFTTRVDTIFGATYVVIAPEHPLVEKLKGQVLNADEVGEYVEKAKRKTELQRISDSKEKTGVALSGVYAVNPMTGESIPVWVADYVLANYGTGAVMAVPAHDERDHEFAKKYNLEIKKVIESKGEAVFTDEGTLVNSDKFNGLGSEEARKKITEELASRQLGSAQKNYRLHDWILSRQRYWGAPIPMIKCEKCGYQPVPEKDLPVELPKLTDFLPVEGGKSPLARADKWVKVKCPNCGEPAERETDTMDTFVDSSWYFMRYTDSNNKKEFADKDKMKAWLPAPLYIGGREHNTMHLLYARFITKALHSLGLVDFTEPFISRKNHGVIMAPDGKRMSKSRGNVIDPDTEVVKHGSDTVRMNFAFLGPFEQDYAWNSNNIEGISRFLNRVWNFAGKYDSKKTAEENSEVTKSLNKAIKETGQDIKEFKFNTGVSGLMKLLNAIDGREVSKQGYEIFTKLLAPFAPHLAEEIWMEILKNKESVHLQEWPKYDDSILVEETVSLVIQVNGRMRDVIEVKRGLSEEEAKQTALASESVKKHIAGQEIRNFIYIKDKLANIVI